MYQYLKLVLILLSMLLIGCSQRLPPVSHAHIGHALTAWRGTPDEQGLFVVAEQETRTALSESIAAIVSGQNEVELRSHLLKTLSALDPDQKHRKRGISYGAIRALSGATNHMIYASESDDASQNLKMMVLEFAEKQEVVLDRMKLAVEVARLAQQSTRQEQQDLLLQLRSTLYSILEGEDLDRDGNIGSRRDEYGLQQLRKIISRGLETETPAYQPVEKKYLLGLIRLPSGIWEYRFNASGNSGVNANNNGPSAAYNDDYEDYK